MLMEDWRRAAYLAGESTSAPPRHGSVRGVGGPASVTFGAFEAAGDMAGDRAGGVSGVLTA
jgi:hypothetical protein